MAKILRKSFIFLIGLFAFLGAGFLFAGCGVDYSKISLVAEVDGGIELEVGEEKDITFKILGYQKGFSSEIKIDCKNDGQTKIFEEVEQESISNSEIKVTIRAVAGGVGQIYAKTLEAGKECYVDISVSQTSSSMKRGNDLLYVSNSTPFIPDSSLFKFDANTTIKDVNFYFIQKPVLAQGVDFSTYEISEFEFGGSNPYALFKDSQEASWSANLFKFEKISLSDEFKIVLDNNSKTFDLSDTFDILAVYAPSVKGEKLVYCVSSVNVLPDISAKVYGRYSSEENFEELDFENSIVIVPNNNSKREYLLKVEIENSPVGSPLNIDKTSLNHYINIDFINVSTESERYLNDVEYKAFIDGLINDEVAGKKYYYLTISQNARTQVLTPFSLNIFYDVAQSLGDESVNFVADLIAEIQIAPTSVLINGSQSPDKLTLYNYYRYPEFGWNELNVSVVSGMDETPNFEGVYFDFDDELLEITYQGIIIKKGEENLYKDLTDSFYIRGKQGAAKTNDLEVKVYVKSNVLEEELDPAILTCDIIAGATRISRNSGSEVFYVDMLDGKNQKFNHQLYADQVFQYFTYKKIGGADVVELELTESVFKLYEGEDGKYFLDILLSPKAEGVGIYRLYLDNGMSIDLTFSVVGTLKSETTYIEIHDSDTKVYSSSSKSEESDYFDVYEYEILNPSDNQAVSFGNNLNLEIFANIDATGGIDVPEGDNDFKGKNIVSVKTSGNILNIQTLENGLASFKVVLRGSKVKKTEEEISFELEPTELVYYIKIYSYSKASEFYLLNGANLALNNVVYYGKNDALLREDDKNVGFDIYVKNDNINNFYRYNFIENSIRDMFDDAREKPIYMRDDNNEIIYDANENPVVEKMNYDYNVVSNQIGQELCYESFDKKFVYFYVSATSAVLPKLKVNITKYSNFKNDGTPSDSGETKEITLLLPQGLIFDPSDEIIYEAFDDDEKLVSRYVAEFTDKIFVFDKLGEFNVNTLTYTNARTGNYSIQLTAYLSQREQTKTYTAKIVSTEYLSTEAISLSSNLTSLDFQNDILSYDLGVYTFPTYATNKDISIDFVTTNGSIYTDLLTPSDFEIKKLGNGAFNITISCENFVNNFSSRHDGMNIIEAEDVISGKIYIYPSDWGANYSLISGNLSPICLDVSYRNGSRKNPYLISSAEDLKNINLSKQKLNSHYEVRTNVDLSSVENFVPIGIFNDGENDEIVGFGGTITGTTSIAGFSNLNITKDNFSKTIENVLYSGLFAQINGPTEKTQTSAATAIWQTAQIENLLLSGSIQLQIDGSELTSANVGLLAAVNKGNIVNVEADLQMSEISSTSLATLNFGALAGISTGRVLQDFRAYEGRKSQDGKYYEVYDISQVYKNEDNFVYAYRENGDVLYKLVDEYGYLLDGTEKVKSEEKTFTGVQDFEGQTPRKMANYLDALTISGNITYVYAGGVVGYGNGMIERILPESSDFKLFGYMAYSAIANINVVSTTSSIINLGGIIGKYALDNGYFKDFGLKLKNLLVGGEVSSFNADLSTTAVDSVGGVVGTIDTQHKEIVYILSNKARTFVRAQNYAGALVGSEIYTSSDYASNYVYYENKNIIEAVDDGRGVFFSSQVISGEEGNKNLSAVSDQIRVAIGNSRDSDVSATTGNNVRNYDSTTSFTLVSYSERIALAVADNVNLSDLTRSTTYGDRILVEKTASGVNVKSQINYPRQSVTINAVSATDTLDYFDGTTTYHAYLMYYFALTGTLVSGDGTSLQKAMEELNVVSPQSKFYPFSLNNSDVVLNVSSSNILSVDANGNITVKTTGLSTMVLSSILNVNKIQNVDIYVFNYFNKNIDSSIFYSGKSIESLNITDNSTIVVYGNSTTSINVIPSYYLESTGTTKGANYTFSITKDGKLSYSNQTYYLAKNAEISADITKTEDPDTYFSYAQTNKQTITFSKNVESVQGDKDKYTLVPTLTKTIKVNGEPKPFKMNFGYSSKININVEYREVATFIASGEDNYAIDTNGYFEDEIKVISTNPSEFVFYQITRTIDGVDEIVQERLPSQEALQGFTEEEYLKFVNFEEDYSSEKGENYIFNFDIGRKTGNFFNMHIFVDKESDTFKNRAQRDIYGEYKVHLYASQLEEGVEYTFSIWLSEAQVNYLVMKNYSNKNNISIDDKKIVPSQQGILEIDVDPAEAVFDRFEIVNDSKNSSNASFTFVYEKVESGQVEYIVAPNFGRFANGKLSFSYADMMQFFEDVGEEYNGKIYIAYILPSNNVENGVEIKFNAKVIFDNGAQEEKTTIILTTKLSNFVKLTFSDKKLLDENYYVARGLSYGLDLSLFGFGENQIEFSYSNGFVSVEKQNGKYILSVTKEAIPYDNTKNGFWTEIYVTAKKEVDGVLVVARSTLGFYIMEYVLNYAYVEGEYEDLVERVNDGVLSTSIGNPVALKFAINQMLEYDSSNETIRQEVEFFANNMTNGITWKVWKNGLASQIGGNVSIKDEYYLVDGLVVTPLRLYQPESDIYHFSLEGNYKIAGGIYVYDEISTGSNQIYSEFAFEVHDQSTEDSPIPVRSYEDFANMNVGEWYILLDDIVLPSSEYASVNSAEQFVPFDKQIAGLDGNGYEIIFNGTYNFEDETEMGLFSQVYSGEILKNIKVKIAGNTTFNASTQTFKVGILTPTNNGIITNCESVCADGKVFSVISSVATTDSYVAGLVAENTSSGIITNSRSKVTIYAYENIGGFVGKNAGHIASSYFMGAIKNQSTASTEKTAGFVVENKGKIYTSYVSGVADAGKVYYDGSNNNSLNIIQSSGNVAGFVYTNDGEDAKIADCYSNILLKQSSAFASGFVYENSGNIQRCFSTSVLDNSQNSNYGFVRINRNSSGSGIISDCFFLQDNGINENISVVEAEGVSTTALKVADFGNMTNFSAFSYTQGRKTNSVWFFNNEAGRAENFDGQIFNTGRLELVAPNIIAQSRRNLSGISEIEEGDTTLITYIYSYDTSYPSLGSIYNPILISSAEDMEKYISNETSAVGYNYCAYRLISNVDYTTYQSNSALYKTKFLGYLEGNFLSVSGTSLTSSEVLENAGLFGQVGSSSVAGADGTLLNFTFTPKIVSFANTMVVGALTGTLDGGSVINVEVLLGTNEKLVVTGYNIVGGAIGLSKGNFKIENLYSELSAKTRNSAIKDTDNIEELAGQYQYCSYAGSIVGAVSGQGIIKNTIINREKTNISNVSVMGRKAGLAFGYVGQNVFVDGAEIYVTPNMIVNAYEYGGFLAGQSKGRIENVKINSFGSEFENFRKVPNIPTAIGGLVGLVSGGTITNAIMNQSFSVSSQSSNAGVQSVGGLVGEIENACTISKVTINANLTGYQYVGGLAGSILEASGNVNFEDIIFEGNINIVGLSVEEIGVGGLVGRVEGSSILALKISKDSDIEDDDKNKLKSNISIGVYVYGTGVAIYTGGIIGRDKSNVNHSISYTKTEMSLSGFAFDLSSSAGTKDVGLDGTISVSKTAQNTTFKDSVSMQISDDSSSSLVQIYLLNFGTQETA